MSLLKRLRPKKPAAKLSTIKLDLNISASTMPTVDMVFLGLAVLLSVAVVADYFNSRAQIASIQQAATGTTTSVMPISKIGSNELNAAQSSMEKLALPWNVLFAAMESAASDKVKLISLEPDAEKRRMRIVAETEDVYGMLEYVRRLSAQPGLSNITLSNQQVEEDQQKSVVRFTVDGSWAL